MLLALTTNMRLGWKGLPRTNTLAYLSRMSVTKKGYNFDTWRFCLAEGSPWQKGREGKLEELGDQTWANVRKLFSSQLINGPNKLECFSLAWQVFPT